jgi:hypothetical protein
MTKQDLTENTAKWAGAVLGFAALIGMLIAATGFERKEDHEADILRVEKKLDCALWNLPAGCRETMSPRGP